MIKTIEIFNGLKINVSSDGEVYTLEHHNIRSNGRIDNRKGRKLKQKTDRYGYKVVTFSYRGIRKSYTVHRLVAMAYIENPMNKETVNHINGIKTDNRINNLEWATQSEQKRHSINHHLCDKNMNALHDYDEKISIPIIYKGKKYKSINEARKKNHIGINKVKKLGVVA